jgi:DNA-binding MarR family transcriptional regulator
LRSATPARSAARARGVAISTVSRRIDVLENALGLQLVDRRTDGARLTESGLAIAEAAAPLAEQMLRVARHGLADAVTIRAGGLVELQLRAPLPVREPWMIVHRDQHALASIKLVQKWVAMAFASLTDDGHEGAKTQDCRRSGLASAPIRAGLLLGRLSIASHAPPASRREPCP